MGLGGVEGDRGPSGVWRVLACLAACSALLLLLPLPAVKGDSAASPDSQASSQAARPHGDVSSTGATATDGAPRTCVGRQIFVHDLPPKFNEELLFDASRESEDWFAPDVAQILVHNSINSGLGERVGSVLGVPGLEGAWFNTDHNALERIFHARMRTYPCRVAAYDSADMVYVPYYGRHDSLRNGWKEFSERDRLAEELLTWLQAHPAWRRRNGADHFWVFSTPLWDLYRRPRGNWGTKLLAMEGVKDNMWTLTAETTWEEKKVISAPYPVGFHPASMGQVQAWQEFVRARERKWLFAMVSGRRSNGLREGALRHRLFWQCEESGDTTCRMVDCSTRYGAACRNTTRVFEVYASAEFCLHPIGDACTRRSLLDAALVGCIPVVFYNCTLKDQYQWHLGDVIENEVYVFIPEKAVRGPKETQIPNKVWIEDRLRQIPADRVQAMRERLISLIPKFIYGAKLEGEEVWAPDFHDGADVIIDNLLTNMRGVKAT